MRFSKHMGNNSGSTLQKIGHKMGLWDAISGKTYKQNKFVGDITGYFLPRCHMLPEGFGRDYCMASLIASDILVEGLIFEKWEGKKADGGMGDINPFHVNLNKLTPEGSIEMFRISVLYRLAFFLMAEEHHQMLSEIGVEIKDLEGYVATVFELNEGHTLIYKEITEQLAISPPTAQKTMYNQLHLSAFGRDPTPDIAALLYMTSLLTNAAAAFANYFNSRT